MKQLLAISQLRTQSQQVQFLGATFKQKEEEQEEEEVVPPNQQRCKEILAEGYWGCRKSTRVKGKVGQTSRTRSSTENN